MIIKSLSRQNRSFEALYDYLAKDRFAELFSHNLLAKANDRQRVVLEFEDNAQYIKNARGKNYLFHEILSLKESNLDIESQKRILLKLADEYINKRAEEHLIFSALHSDKEHLHIHLMISSNRVSENKRIRLSKAQFANIQKEIESFQNTNFPELYSAHYQNSSNEFDKSKTSTKEQDIKTRGAKSKKDALKEQFLLILQTAKSFKEFEQLLKASEITLYKRGSTEGLIFKDKNYRLNTLGVLGEYHSYLRGLDEVQSNTANAEVQGDIKSKCNDTKQDSTNQKDTESGLNLKSFINEALETSRTKEEFYRLLLARGVEFYDRDGFSEVYYDSKWHRLNTLGIAREYEVKNRKWQAEQKFRRKTSFRDTKSEAFKEFEQSK